MIRFETVEPKKIHEVQQLASEIWNDNYKGIISDKQINYMLNLMYSSKQLKHDLEEGYQWELITNNDVNIGYLAYVIKNDNRVFLSKIYLKTTAQGLGLGKKAINRVKEYAKSKNCPSIYLTVNKNNLKGIRAYNNLGFTIVNEEITNIGEGYVMDDYVFEFVL